MCRPVTCRTCSKTTWAGCGRHVDQVMAGVPTSRRCSCGTTTDASSSGGFWSRLRRR